MNDQKLFDRRVNQTADETKTMVIGNITFTYMDKGHGVPVILVHCSGGTHRQWLRASGAFGERYRVLAPDLHGHGKTPLPAEPASSFNCDVAIVKALAEQVEGPFHLVGHSYGGCVALHAAMALHKRLLSLTLIEPSAFYLLRQKGESAAWEEINKVAIRQMDLSEKGELESCAEEFMSYWTGKPASEAVPERCRKSIALTMPSIAAIWGSLFDQSFGLKDFARFPFPTLLIRGTETRIPAKKIVDILNDGMVNRSLVEIPGAGHMLPVTHPEQVNAALIEHLDRYSTLVTSDEEISSAASPVMDTSGRTNPYEFMRPAREFTLATSRL